MAHKNRLYYGDNLEVLRNSIPDESVDLVYLDPPFNSNRNYNVIFGKHVTANSDDIAQIQAFGDTWTWTPQTDDQFQELVTGVLPNRPADALVAMRTLLTENDAMAYLVNMAPRLVELHRVLTSTGTLYLHCDSTMSHYLKVLLDAIFGPDRFLSEVIWKRTGSHNSAKRWGPQHDVILVFTKSATFTWNRVLQEYDPLYISEKFKFSDARGLYQDVSLMGPGSRSGGSGKPWRNVNPTDVGRHWQPPSLMYDFYESLTGDSLAELSMQERLDKADEAGIIHWPAKKDGKPRFKQYLDISPGVALQDVISDIAPLNSAAAERLGYPTQKPIALMERILQASSNPGDVVLDPFCGCGTTVDAAQKLKRSWVGIDVTYLSIDLIVKRLEDRYGPALAATYEVAGIPRDKAAALALFSKSPFDFERWAVSLLNAQPNEKQVGDKGIDGVARFPLGDPNQKGGGVGRILMSVKGGKTIGPQFVRDLLGTVETQKAQMGILITMAEPTRGILDAVNHAGSYAHPGNKQSFPKIQVITVSDLLTGKRPNLPSTVNPYITATKSKAAPSIDSLF